MDRKHFYFFSILFFFTLALHGQNIAPVKKATMNFELLQYISKHSNSSEIMNILVQGNSNTIATAVRENGGVIKFSYGDIASARIPLNRVSSLMQNPSVKRIEARHGNGAVLDNESDINANISPVKQGAHPLPQGYDGSGVVIGVIDDGIDLSHPDFRDSLGHTRVKHVWSQIDNTGGTTPSYGYGQEWDSAAIDAGSPYVSTSVNFGHGSIVTGCAAGNGRAVNNYHGVATNADIIFVAIDLGGNFLNNMVDATDYIYKKAAALGKPCVINASVGTYSGSHDGRDLPAKMIDNLITAQNGRAFVCAAGNAGNVLLHLGYQVQQDSLFSWFRYEAGLGRVFFELWGKKSEMDSMQFALGADKTNPFLYRGRTPFYNMLTHFNLTSGIDTLTDTLWSGNKILGVIQILAELEDSTYHLGISIFTDSTTYNWRFITFGSGYFDIWSQPTYTGTSNILKANLPSSGTFPDIVRYKLPNRNQTIVSSFTCSDKTIAVANFTNRDAWIDVNNNIQTSPDTVGARGTSSSIGPTRDGRIKPDISAPGDGIFGSGLLSLMPSFITNNPQKVGVGGKHILDGGTSMASPVVAGIVALYLQKRPNASWQEIKDVLLNTAKQDAFTTSILPNTKWGYGKVEAFAALNYYGCKDHSALNYDSLSIVDDGSCKYATACTGCNPVPPSSVNEFFVGKTIAKISWNTDTCVARYRFYYRTFGSKPWTNIIRGKYAGYVTLKGLAPGTVYEYKIVTVCPPDGDLVWSKPSAIKTFKTTGTSPFRMEDNASVLSTYPNPFSEFTNIYYKTNSPFTKGFIVVTNALGQEVSRVELSGQEGNINFAASSLTAGIYFYQLVTDGKIISTKKMVVF